MSRLVSTTAVVENVWLHLISNVPTTIKSRRVSLVTLIHGMVKTNGFCDRLALIRSVAKLFFIAQSTRFWLLSSSTSQFEK